MLDERLTEVINGKSGDFLVIGPPGSGKTHTLLELAGYLVNTKKIKPEKILIFCFNRRWSKLIREETASLINKSILEIPIETFHSFCTRFINRSNVLLYQNLISGENYCKEKNNEKNMDDCITFGDLKVLNSVQQWEFLKSVIRTLDEKKYPYTFRYINCNTFTENSYIQEVFDFILRAQENLFTPEELLKRFTPFFNPVLSELSGIYSGYIKELRRNRLYNYGMLLEETVNILKTRKEIRDYYKYSYEYILIDELQEINRAQFSIIEYLSNSNCIFFGNDDQSIYTFRGSAQNIFKLVYHRLEPKNVIYLKKNYRNSHFINESCNKFIGLIKDRIPKEITSSDNKPGGELHLKEFHTLLEEANFICRKIKSLYFKKGTKLEEMAIIIKGLGYETHIIENSLLLNGIPFVRRGTRNLLDNKLIKYLLNFMRFLIAVKGIEDPGKTCSDSGEDSNNSVTELNFLIENLMLSEVVNLEPLYFKKLKNFYVCNGNDTSSSLWNYFKSQWIKVKNNRKDGAGGENVEGHDMRENYKKNGEDSNINNPSGELLKIIDFVSAVYRLIEIMDSRDVFEFSLILVRDRGTGIMNYLKVTGDNKTAGRNWWLNLGDFLNNVKDFSIKNVPGDVRSYINFVDNVIESKFTEEIEESTKDMIQPGSVNLFSFHQCKGLEFKAVFIPFINKDYLPAKFIFNQAYDTRIFSYPDGMESLNIGELKKEHMYGEIRLFYNGITRAGEYLYITSSSRRKSIFFEEMKKILSDLKPEHKKDNEYKKEKEGKKREIPVERGTSANGNIEISGTGLLDDIDLSNIWLTRKKALVAVSRIQNKFKINHKNYMNHIVFLRHFYNPDRWWDFIMPTENNKNPFNFFPQPFSFSSIDTFVDCPLKYKVKYYFNLREEESVSLIIGKIYHEILRIFFNGKADYSWERLEKIMNDLFEGSNFDFKFLKEDFKKNALIQFKNFFENLMPSNPHSSIVEKGFSFDTGGENITGRIDQINITGDGDIEIIDYKSGSSPYSDRELREELQLKVYRMAVEISKDLKDFKFMNVKMKYICLGNMKKPVYTVPEEYYNRSEIEGKLGESISEIKREKFNPKPKNYNSCSNCGFKILCAKYYG